MGLIGAPIVRIRSFLADENDASKAELFRSPHGEGLDSARFKDLWYTETMLDRSLPTAPTVGSGRTLDLETARAARAFMLRIADRYSVSEGIVYGSRARGDHSADSDADIAVILEGERGDRWEITRDLSGIAFDVLLETGILVQAIPLWEGELQHPDQFSNPALIENIKREGLSL